MIGTIWSNIHTPKPGVQILVGSAETQVDQQVIDLNTVFNRGELVGLLIELVTKVAAPGTDKNLTVFYAFSDYADRTPAQLATAAGDGYPMPLDTGGVNTRRSYSAPIIYQGGRYLHIWFTADTFDGGSQQEVDLRVLAKTMN
jgi:hypothetical protein